jgi:putative PIN family toxin of toxin-antitoxin system
MLEELREALSRPKFKLTPPESLATFQIILSKSEIILNVQEAKEKCRDKDDQKFLDCARTGRADYLVTGDRGLLDIHQVGLAKILRAAQFIRELKTN